MIDLTPIIPMISAVAGLLFAGAVVYAASKVANWLGWEEMIDRDWLLETTARNAKRFVMRHLPENIDPVSDSDAVTAGAQYVIEHLPGALDYFGWDEKHLREYLESVWSD
jgi:hypothetical protein